MTARAEAHPRPPEHRYRHEALLYAGRDGFVEGTSSFIRDALAADEPILVMVGAAKIDSLQAALGPDAAGVRFADMEDVGRNPACIIPAWNEFVAEHQGGAMRGIGEPIWAGRRRDELAESQLHESLLNVAIPDTTPMWLLCPYDTKALEPAVIDHARAHHPFVAQGGVSRDSVEYRRVTAPLDGLLSEAPSTEPFVFDAGQLRDVRARVREHAAVVGLDPDRTTQLVLAANEAASNSVRHAGGVGALRVWNDGDTLVCEIRDPGYIDRPLVGRERPAKEQVGGHGLWLANQLCDLVQVRSSADGTVVRLHMRRA